MRTLEVTSKKKKKKVLRPIQGMALPKLVKELTRADHSIKQFLVNCHPYVVAGTSTSAYYTPVNGGSTTSFPRNFSKKLRPIDQSMN